MMCAKIKVQLNLEMTNDLISTVPIFCSFNIKLFGKITKSS